ncbi:MAG: 50S ribosomal protein L3, partial [Candidatus Aenigmarchaeota archaeon]|nr:50S ribosomal protein L3 [Candidatus Aenigmarchaeota archaeon]
AMSQVFDEDGKVIPVTEIIAGPCLITRVQPSKVQIVFGKKRKINKAQQGQFKSDIKPRWIKEFKVKEDDAKRFKIGETIKVDTFSKGDVVKISALSKGKGFQGVVKRHKFHCQSATHGNKDQLRAPGSIGSTDAARVLKGKRMPGRMGGERVTIKNIKIISVDPTKNTLLVKGAIPGARNNLLEICA